MRNLDKISDFFAFISEAGESVLALGADPWFHLKDGRTDDFIDFLCRQADNMIRIAAAEQEVSEEEIDSTCSPCELVSIVMNVLAHKSIGDFFGLSTSGGRASGNAAPMKQSSHAEYACMDHR